MSTSFGFNRVKVIALPVNDLDRANDFYGNKLGLAPASEDANNDSWMLGDIRLLLKPDWQAPTAEPNPRLTIEVENSLETETALKEVGATISDPVQLYEGKFLLGSFLDSEGNKLWICSQQDPSNPDQ